MSLSQIGDTAIKAGATANQAAANKIANELARLICCLINWAL